MLLLEDFLAVFHIVSLLILVLLLGLGLGVALTKPNINFNGFVTWNLDAKIL